MGPAPGLVDLVALTDRDTGHAEAEKKRTRKRAAAPALPPPLRLLGPHEEVKKQSQEV